MTQPSPGDRKPVADGIPTDLAWRAGRRIYVRCGYTSQLNTQLRADTIRARWDSDVRALWVGSGKADKVLPLLRERLARVDAIEQIKRAATEGGWWLAIPYEADVIRQHAKDADGVVYDSDRKMWACATADSFDPLAAEVRAYREQLTAQRAAEQAADAAALARRREDDAAAAAQEKADREAALLAACGRTVIGERRTVTGHLRGLVGRRDAAEKAKPQRGTVRRMADGTRVLVLSCTVTFYGQDAIDDGFTPGGTGDEIGWYYAYECVPVEATDAERADDQRRHGEAADHDEIRDVLHAARDLARARALGDGEPAERVTGQTITLEAVGYAAVHDGQITVTAGGDVWVYHPGYHDDYIRTQARITGPDLVARVRAVLAGGSRRRGAYVVDTSNTGTSD